MANPATEALTTFRTQQDNPFLRLPVELRIAIYGFALDHIVEDIVAQAQCHNRHVWRATKIRPLCFLFTGALALCHTSYGLRVESISVMKSRAQAKREMLKIAAHQPRTQVEDTEISWARYAAFNQSDRLLKTCGTLVFDQNALAVWCSRIPWSELNRAQKRCVAIECYKGLSREEQADFDELTAGSKEVDFWPALVDVFDVRVERGGMEDFKGVAGFRAGFGAAS